MRWGCFLGWGRFEGDCEIYIASDADEITINDLLRYS